MLGVGGGRTGELVLLGDRISVWEDEKVLELDGGDVSTTVWMYLMPLSCTLGKWLKKKNYVHGGKTWKRV